MHLLEKILWENVKIWKEIAWLFDFGFQQLDKLRDMVNNVLNWKHIDKRYYMISLIEV